MIHATARPCGRLVDQLQCPVLPTYKAKGVIPDSDPCVVGLYVGGAGEQPVIADGDLLIMIGADPVEFALQPWRYPDHPVIELTLAPVRAQLFRAAGQHRRGAGSGNGTRSSHHPVSGVGWTAREIEVHRNAPARKPARRWSRRDHARKTSSIAVCAKAPDRARISVDAWRPHAGCDGITGRPIGPMTC